MTNTEILSIISVATSALAGPALVEWIKAKLSTTKKSEKDLIKESLETNMLVTNKIEDILHSYKADRIWVYQFHNGGNFYPTGKSIQKFSMCYETVSPSAESIQSNFQNIPISLFSKSMNRLLEEGNLAIPDFEDENIDKYNLQFSLPVTKNNSTYQFALKSINNKFIGVVGIDYVKTKTILDDTSFNHLAYEIASIGGVIQQLLNSK